jgi:hypothetical protein
MRTKWLAVRKSHQTAREGNKGKCCFVSQEQGWKWYCIQDRIRLEGFRSVHIRVRIFNIRYCIRIRILKSYIYDVNIQSYLIRHSWHYPYSNSNPNANRNIKINIISVLSVRDPFSSLARSPCMVSQGRYSSFWDGGQKPKPDAEMVPIDKKCASSSRDICLLDVCRPLDHKQACQLVCSNDLLYAYISLSLIAYID